MTEGQITALGAIFLVLAKGILDEIRARRLRADLVEDRMASEARSAGVVAKIEEAKSVTVQKIAENTAINVQAIDTAVQAIDLANHHTEKMVAVKETAVASMETIMAALVQNAKDIAAVRATSEETRRLVEIRLSRDIQQ